MRAAVVTLAIVALTAVYSVTLSLAGAGSADGGKDKRDPVVKQDAPKADRFAWSLKGSLVAVGNNDLTLAVDGQPRRRFLTDGVVVDGQRVAEHKSHSYRLDQLKRGDSLIVDYYHHGGVEYATYMIRRRPGGRVPPQPETNPDARGAWHRAMNAYQDWEEFRIPLPPEYAIAPPPDLNPPYVRPRYVPSQETYVAPPPREVDPATRPPATP